MARYITATEAARRLGVNEKTVRSWVKSGKLDAHKAEKNRFDILVSDVEVLRRKREKYQDDASDVSLLVARIEDLERKCTDLEQKYVGLAAIVAEKDEKRVVSQPARVDAAVPQKRATVTSASVPVDLPCGSMLFADFAAKYGVPRGTFSHHVKKGIAGEIVATMRRTKPGRPDHTEYWLTPDQQMAALAFWDKYGVRYSKTNE